MRGFDQATNLLVSNAHERIFSLSEPVRAVPLGCLLMRGDMVVCVGEIDEQADALIAYDRMRCSPLPPIIH